MELSSLQGQLKVAIQNHQITVAKMKNDPQNSALKKKLRDLQSEIMQLSEKQKQVVQRLRKELENAGTTTVTTAPPSIGTPVCTQPRLLTLSTGIQTQGLSLRVEKPISSVPIAAQQILHQVVPSLVSNLVAASSQQSQPKKFEARFPSPVLVVPSPARTDGQSSVVSSSTAASNSAPLKPPPIRVPQYPPPLNSVNRQTASPNGSVTSTVDTNVERREKRPLPFTKIVSAKKEEPTKLNFMNALGLVNRDVLNELHTKRIERKRRTTANPHFSNAALEEKRRNAALIKPNQGKKSRGRPRLTPLLLPPNSPPSPPTPPNQSPPSFIPKTPPTSLPKPPPFQKLTCSLSKTPFSRSPPPPETPPPLPKSPPAQTPPVSLSPPFVEPSPVPEVKEEPLRLPLATTLIVPHVPSPVNKISDAKVALKISSMNGCIKNVFQRNGGILSEVILCGLCHLRVAAGESVCCVVCSRPHHSRCVSRPPLTPSPGSWTCHKCTMTTLDAHPPAPQKNHWKKDEAKAALKASKEELKKELMKRSRELSRERSKLEDKFHQLADVAAGHFQRQVHLMSAEKRNQEVLDRLHTVVSMVRQS